MSKNQLRKGGSGDKEHSRTEGNTTETRDHASVRRRFITRHINAHGKLLIADLLAAFPGTKPESIKGDIASMNRAGGSYRKVGKEILDGTAPATLGLADRSSMNGEEKSLVADLAVSFLIGFTQAPENKKPSLKDRIYSERQILQWLLSCGPDAKNTAQRVRAILLKHLAETSRIVALDDGTTTLRVAEKLRKFLVPVSGTNLNHLTVCTNSREIFNVLGDSAVEQIRAIVVGGQQIGRSSAIAGPLAEHFLRSCALLQFSVSMVGASSMTVDKGLAFSDTQEEAIIKGILFSKSALRVIVVDNAKLDRRGVRHGYAFCSLDPQFCDLVITNSPIALEFLGDCDEDERKEHAERINEFPDLVKAIEVRGIPVLVAVSERTMKFPYEGHPGKNSTDGEKP